MSEPSRGRIAIKFGAASAAPRSSSRPQPRPHQLTSSLPSTTTALGKRPRPSSHRHALGGASDSDSEDDGERHRGRHERITGFGVEGAETEGGERDVKAPREYIIKRQANRNWKDSVRAKGHARSGTSFHAGSRTQQDRDREEQDPPEEEKTLQWGLTTKERQPRRDTEPDTIERKSTNSEIPGTEEDKDDKKESEVTKPRTADDEAMDALLGRVPEKKDLVIAQPSEDDAYRRDVEAAGAPSTLEDYEAMPVEEFGAALLRGMGWSGEDLGPKIKQVRRRPNRLGLGAKELKEDEELGGWDQNGRKKQQHRPRLDEYRREESKRKESRRHEESYKREREREKERERDGYREGRRERDRDRDNSHRERERERDRDRDYERHRERHRDYDRDRRR